MKAKLLLFLFLLTTSHTHAQQADFCTVLHKLITHGPSRFHKLAGKQIFTSTDLTQYAATRSLPGSKWAVISYGYGWADFGTVLLETHSTDSLHTFYQQYKLLLTDCLTAQRYSQTSEPSKDTTLQDYRTLNFSPETPDERIDTLRPAITYKVNYNATAHKYSIYLGLRMKDGWQ